MLKGDVNVQLTKDSQEEASSQETSVVFHKTLHDGHESKQNHIGREPHMRREFLISLLVRVHRLLKGIIPAYLHQYVRWDFKQDLTMSANAAFYRVHASGLLDIHTAEMLAYGKSDDRKIGDFGTHWHKKDHKRCVVFNTPEPEII